MSSVLFQSINNNGLSGIRGELNRLTREVTEARKDIAVLLKALEAKSPEAAEEFVRLKANEAFVAQQVTAGQQGNNRFPPQQAVNTFNNSFQNRR